MARYQGLPPVDQIVGFNTAGNGAISPNPVQGQFQYFTDSQGNPISAVNAGDATANFDPFGGNPLYYGQTATYTGPSGETDSPNVYKTLPVVEDAVASADPLGAYNIGDLIQLNNAAQKGNPYDNIDVFKMFERMEDGTYNPRENASGGGAYANVMYRGGVPLHQSLKEDGSELGKQAAMMQAMNQFALVDDINYGGGDGGD
jgi:hypothetical protein